MIARASPDDPRVAAYRQVGNPDWLRGNGLFVAEGRLVVERLLAAARYDILSIVVTTAAARAMDASLQRACSDVLVVEPDVLDAVTGFNFHRGCLALVRRPQPLAVPELLDRIGTGCLLAMEGVGNPDNVGGLFRTAAAFGTAGVLLDRTSGDPFYRKALRTSMGAVLQVPFARADDWAAALAAIRERPLMLVALTPDPTATPLEEIELRLAGSPCVLLVGAEGAGLSAASAAAAHARVRIPISRDVDSLNVIVAAGIALHAWRRH